MIEKKRKWVITSAGTLQLNNRRLIGSARKVRLLKMISRYIDGDDCDIKLWLLSYKDNGLGQNRFDDCIVLRTQLDIMIFYHRDLAQ